MVGLHEDDPAQRVQDPELAEDTFGEQYFPRQMSWYAAEGPQGLLAAGARRVREHPWMAIGVALAAGMALALAAGPLLRGGACALEAATRGDEPQGMPPAPE